MSETYREAILLRDYHGGSWAFLQSELDLVSEEAARKLYSRARIKLGGLLRSHLDSEDRC